MPYTDTHCHLQYSRLAETLPEVLARARKSGIARFVCCGSSETDWNDVLSLAARETDVIPMLGLHPWYISQAKPGWDTRLFNLLQTNTAGVGECGLDFAIPDADRDAQTTALETQWHMALKLNRPLSLHCRKAFDIIFNLAENLGLPTPGAVIHAFSGSSEQAKIAIRHGFYLSFACSLLNPTHKRVRSALMVVPPERLMLETDSPDIPPIPGTLNEPSNLVKLLKAVSELKGETTETLEKQLQENACKVFL
jgi:TatD DNase family protein